MIFYLFHNIINNINFTDNWNESKKNCLTLIVGGTLYVILYVLLEYLYKKTYNIFFDLMHKFFFYFVIVDAITMAVLYKLYWGRSIINEITPSEDKWHLDEENHKYKSHETLAYEDIRNFNNKSNKLDELEKNVENLGDNIENLEENIKDIEEKTDEMETAILFQPGGTIEKNCENDFINKSNEQQNN